MFFLLRGVLRKSTFQRKTTKSGHLMPYRVKKSAKGDFLIKGPFKWANHLCKLEAILWQFHGDFSCNWVQKKLSSSEISHTDQQI